MESGDNRIISNIAELKTELQKEFGVISIGLFGSFAKGNENPDSDVDILVELEDPTFDNYMDLKFRLEDVLDRTVDLVLLETVKPRLKPVIEREVIYV